MADDNSAQSKDTWPLVKFSFQVKWDDQELIFQEVTGLSSETRAIEYISGSSTVCSIIKMPGIQKLGNVTLKKGMFLGDKVLWEKHKLTAMNVYKRATITISLLDEKNEVAMSWTLANAFPLKITVSDMKSDGNEVAVESIELAHEGLAIV
jgi:phage tail-like protein